MKRIDKWVSSMSGSSSDVTIGQNPSLPMIIHNTWGWPWVSFEYHLEGRVVALLSFFRIRKTWVSLPHFNYDSLWIDLSFLCEKFGSNIPETENFSKDVSRSLYKIAFDSLNHQSKSIVSGLVISIDLDVTGIFSPILKHDISRSVNIKFRNPYPLLPNLNSSKVIPTLVLQRDYNLQLSKFSSNVRRKIRKSVKNEIRVEKGGLELLDQFYSIYRQNVHRLGSFGLPKYFFQNLLNGYRFGKALIFIAKMSDKIVGGAILLSYLSHAENPWFASHRDFNRYYVTYALHNEMIRFAINEKCKMYSFGRSTVNSSVHLYKMHWGTIDFPLILNSLNRDRFNQLNLTFARQLIRYLPEGFVQLFDSFISTRIY